MSRSQREKGARGEREVAAMLATIYPEAARRASGEESQDSQGRDLKGTPGLCVQVQLSARPAPDRKLDEALAAAAESELPVAFTRRTPGGAWRVTLLAEHFMQLLSSHLEGQRACEAWSRDERYGRRANQAREKNRPGVLFGVRGKASEVGRLLPDAPQGRAARHRVREAAPRPSAGSGVPVLPVSPSVGERVPQGRRGARKPVVQGVAAGGDPTRA